MIIKFREFSLFLKPRQFGDVPIRKWVCFKTGDYFVRAGVMIDEYEKVAVVLGLDFKRFKEGLLAYLGKGKAVRAVECLDCILAHPRWVGSYVELECKKAYKRL